jgi:hypothetical protein
MNQFICRRLIPKCFFLSDSGEYFAEGQQKTNLDANITSLKAFWLKMSAPNRYLVFAQSLICKKTHCPLQSHPFSIEKFE